MEFVWDFFTITLFALATVDALLATAVWLKPFVQLCCLRTPMREMNGFRKNIGTLTQVMLSISVGLFIQSFADTQISCADTNCWVVVPIISILVSLVMLILFKVVGDWVVYVAAGAGTYWLLNQLLPGGENSMYERIYYYLYAGAVLASFTVLCFFKARIRQAITDWILGAVACGVIVYYADYWTGASLNHIEGPTIDLIGPEQYPYQRLYHIVEMTVLYALNRGATVGAAIALQCYSSKPGDCAYQCRNRWCCCCCYTDRPTQENARERLRLQRMQRGRPEVEQLDDLDYGPTRPGEEWRTIPERPEGAREGYDDDTKDGEDSDDESEA